MEIKIGDKLEYWGYSVSCDFERERYDKGLCPVVNDERHLKPGNIYEVVALSYYGTPGYGDIQGVSVKGDNITVYGCSFSNFRKINNNNMIKSIKSLFKKEPEKSFIKAGLMDEDENITDKGKEALEHILWYEKRAELKKIADQIIEDFQIK